MDVRDVLGLILSTAAIIVCLLLAVQHDYKTAAVIAPMALAGLGFIGGFAVTKGNDKK